ncbi:hypothetical protein [Celeribacter sp.]|uniref:hypothetical protein n=1 Tax=Celeribacter sp. TaxID=1890673 RepID=UPI003A924C58
MRPDFLCFPLLSHRRHAFMCLSFKGLLTLCAALLLWVGGLLPAMAAESGDKAHLKETLRSYFETEMADFIMEPVLLIALREQNARTAELSEAEILELDQQWREQLQQEEQPLLDTVLKGRPAELLLGKVAMAGGEISELFVMDARGLNVTSATATSDYWQGDEAKFQKSFGQGPDGMEIGGIEFDPSTGVSQAQVSATITDPSSGEPIGAVTVGLVVDLLL